ncbi:MAG: hypothetical protein F6K48_02950 [Okeania sp. SIO3H1]|nr:hypothetical protein [Okeania sp. SIO3H1]
MPRSAYWTIGVMIALTVIGIVFDLIVFFNEHPGDTISEVLYEGSIRWFLLPFTFGMAAAHFFFPRKEPVNNWPGIVNATVAIGVVGLINFFVVLLTEELDIAAVHLQSIAALLIGAGYGHFYWSNGRMKQEVSS